MKNNHSKSFTVAATRVCRENAPRVQFAHQRNQASVNSLVSPTRPSRVTKRRGNHHANCLTASPLAHAFALSCFVSLLLWSLALADRPTRDQRSGLRILASLVSSPLVFPQLADFLCTLFRTGESLTTLPTSRTVVSFAQFQKAVNRGCDCVGVFGPRDPHANQPPLPQLHPFAAELHQLWCLQLW